jgi:hypothetical protein
VASAKVGGRLGNTLIVVASVLVIGSASRVGAQTMYSRAVLDSTAGLQLTTSTGRRIFAAKDSGQVGFAAPAISSNRRRVGWLALYPNCCTSYPIPLKLVVRTADKDHVFEGNGLPIWKWTFVDGGARVAFQQTPVHGDAPAHYELRDAGTGRLIEAFDEAVDPARRSASSVPRWVRTVDQAKPPQT